ncbi:MAG TPA: serine/threonine protein kinase [Kofleriaceae bacterium]|jgi:serine/threonine protein kinase
MTNPPSLAGAPRPERVGRALASPTGVMILVPLLVIAAGLAVLLLGRRATRDASDSMARRQLATQAADVQHDVAFALDQADSLLASLRALADPALPLDATALRMRDLQLGRPGVANLSIAFPTGVMRGTFVDPASGELRVQQSVVGEHATTRTNLSLAGGPHVVGTETTNYDPRTRPQWALATTAKQRVWMPPRTFFTSHATGLTVAEPIYDTDGKIRAVTTVDFDVTELSAFVVRAPFDGARTIVFAGDGTILAYPAAELPANAIRENRLLRHEDFADPAIEALFATLGTSPTTELRYLDLHAPDGEYLASVAPLGGKRAGIAAPLDWYLATLVPERVLLGPTHRLEKQSVLASAGALAIALGVALLFAWNLVRMRRAVTSARAQARAAEARATELGSYRLVGRLGIGGMGEVWRAEHRLLARQAAIKLVRPESLRDPAHAPKIRERFRREAQTLATMRSQHTIALYDYGTTDDGTFFYVMELLDGIDLDKLLRDHGPQPAARVIKLLIQACQSLAEAHEAGLLHRDIKPANLFLCRIADEVDVLKVLDFGIVHAMNEGDPAEVISLPVPDEPAPRVSGPRLTAVGSLVGTPGYIAPEQAYGQAIDARADLYALGCVAWWLLAGNEVFPRDDDDAAIRSHAQEPVPALRPRVAGWLPAALEELVLACLAKDPAKRPHDARAMIATLRAIEIPAMHAWSDDRAGAWWTAHLPTPAASPSTDNARTILPIRSTGDGGATLEGKLSSRRDNR